MLRDVVKTFLESLSEREFDAPLLGLLAAQGFTDVHFIHGGFEFGKDVIAKRLDPDDSTLRQYSIQSKAGDIGAAEWRAVRPQLEECEYNTRAHPNFDANLPRTAVLVTTGILKGSAPVDAQEFRAACASRGLADFELWDQEDLLDWLCNDPALGLSGIQVQDDLFTLLNGIGKVTEPAIELHTRRWISPELDKKILGRAAIEASLLTNHLRQAHRLDLAALVALHLYRAAWSPTLAEPSPTGRAALRLFTATAVDLLDQAEPLLEDPKYLANEVVDIAGVFTYPATCNRLAETFSLLALAEPEGRTHDRAIDAVVALAKRHPGTTRPPSDQFAAAILPTTTVLLNADPDTARAYLRAVAKWIFDQHDETTDGLGLGGIDETERIQFERLVAGKTTLTELTIRRSSYMAGVLLDAIRLADTEVLYDTVRDNLEALRIVPFGTAARERIARWRRGGGDVHPQPRIEYPAWAARLPWPPLSEVSAIDAVLLASVTRTRHYPAGYQALLAPAIPIGSPPAGL